MRKTKTSKTETAGLAALKQIRRQLEWQISLLFQWTHWAINLIILFGVLFSTRYILSKYILNPDIGTGGLSLTLFSVGISIASILSSALVFLKDRAARRKHLTKVIKSRHAEFFESVGHDLRHLIQEGNGNAGSLPRGVE
jgi:hypothetical protein